MITDLNYCNVCEGAHVIPGTQIVNNPSYSEKIACYFVAVLWMRLFEKLLIESARHNCAC